MLQKKPGVSNFVTTAYISSKKIIDIYFYFWGYETSKGPANIQDCTAHWVIKKKQMVNVWTFDLESESSHLENMIRTVNQIV